MTENMRLIVCASVFLVVGGGLGYCFAYLRKTDPRETHAKRPTCTAGLCDSYQLPTCPCGLCAYHHKNNCYDFRTERYICGPQQEDQIAWMPMLKEPPRA